MDRRAFVAGTLSLLAAPLPAEAQRNDIPRIGYVGNGSGAIGESSREAFLQGLRDLGWVDGQNVIIEYRWAEGHAERLPALVTELVRDRVNVIIAAGPNAIRAAQQATRTIPIVFMMLADPIRAGLVASLARPGGNITGLASQFEELITKQLELLTEAIPGVARVAFLVHAESVPTILSEAEIAARRLALETPVFRVAGVSEFENAFSLARRAHAQAVHVLPSPFFNASRGRLIELAARYRLPAVYEFKDFVDDGGLMSYGPSVTEMFRGMASYVDRILKGAKPADLPIERPTKFQLVINLKTAKALGLAIPPSVLARADEVIE